MKSSPQTPASMMTPQNPKSPFLPHKESTRSLGLVLYRLHTPWTQNEQTTPCDGSRENFQPILSLLSQKPASRESLLIGETLKIVYDF